MKDRPNHVAPTFLFLSRLLLGAIFLWHGIPKAFAPAAALEKFAGFGLPPILGPMTGWIEVVAAFLLLFGVLHRAASWSLLVIIVGALVTVQLPAGITAGLERDLLILATLSLLVVEGPGRFTLRPETWPLRVLGGRSAKWWWEDSRRRARGRGGRGPSLVPEDTRPPAA